MCAYHGWVYDRGGQCVRQPAAPDLTPPPNARLTMFDVCERYGVIFVALGRVPNEPPAYFPEWDVPGVRQYHHEPQVVNACGPRIIENFLDMAHFPFVHAGVLGAESHTEVRDYTVTTKEDGIEVTGCLFWQPAAAPGAAGADVEYSYRVPHPYVATLSKLPRDFAYGFSLMIMASPVDEEHCRAWMIGAFTDPDVSTEEFHDFNQRIFTQDVPILESQRPRPLPLDPTAELAQKADRASSAYRRWLAGLGLTYGTGAGPQSPLRSLHDARHRRAPPPPAEGRAALPPRGLGPRLDHRRAGPLQRRRSARRRPGRAVPVHQPQPVPLDLRRHLRQPPHRRRLPPHHLRGARGRRCAPASATARCSSRPDS